MYKLICQKPAIFYLAFLSGIIAVHISFFQVSIVLRMYNFVDMYLEISGFAI